VPGNVRRRTDRKKLVAHCQRTGNQDAIPALFVRHVEARRENMDLLLVVIVLLLLFGGGGGLYWGLGMGWGIGPVGLIVAALVIAYLLHGYRGRQF
jgi:hypothetical protein